MPLIKLKHISSFSSEDTAQPSSNLLKPETYRKWRCAKPGEKQAVVVFELEKATRIHAIDIGNNGSALIEVLVGRSSDSSDQYKVILVTSSFMSPAESKTFTSTSRVRMFGSDKLSKPVAEEKWDKVKIVCSQPFNKNERYGLSFVSLHSPPEDSSNNGKDDNAVPTPKRLGSFTLKDEEEDTLKPGSLFFQNKKTKTSVSSTAAQVRDAAASTSTNSDKSSVAGSFFKNRHSVSTKPNEERKRKPEKQESKPDKLEITEKKQVKPVTKERPVKQGRPVSSANISEANSPPPKKSKKQKTENIPFHQILKSTVFVLSGFKNPERSELRDKALEMGAQYRADWVVGCTHLICAFSNTPKYYQVKGKGKIVTKKWILDSHRKKRKLPTKNYHLPGDTSSSEGSSNEEDTTSNSPDHSKTKVSNAEKSTNNEDIRAKKSNQQEISPYDEDTDEEIVTETKKKENPKETDSEQDTEDELERVQPKDEKEEAEDIYDISTEDEDDDQDQNDDESGSEGLPELPDFFSKKHFLLYGEMDPSLRRTLIRYITAYDGVIEDYMTESVDFVITNETWDENFEEALAENSSLAFIKPKWIYACHEESAMAPFQPYIITPS